MPKDKILKIIDNQIKKKKKRERERKKPKKSLYK